MDEQSKWFKGRLCPHGWISNDDRCYIVDGVKGKLSFRFLLLVSFDFVVVFFTMGM